MGYEHPLRAQIKQICMRLTNLGPNYFYLFKLFIVCNQFEYCAKKMFHFGEKRLDLVSKERSILVDL